jgi:hypothetical protein
MSDMFVRLEDALLGPFALSGARQGALQDVRQGLLRRLAALRDDIPLSEGPAPDREAAERAVDELRDAAQLDRLCQTGTAFPDDLAVAIRHGVALGDAWLSAKGLPGLDPETLTWLEGRLRGIGLEDTSGWADHLVESRAFVLPIDGVYGPRSVRLIQGPIDAVRADAWVVSGPPKTPADPEDEIGGATFRHLSARFGSLDRASWRPLVRLGPGTPFWPPSGPALSDAAYLARCGVWYRTWPAFAPGAEPPCRHLLALRNVPPPMLKPARPAEQLRAWIDAVFAALAIVGSLSEAEEAPRRVRISLFGLRQFRGMPTEDVLDAIVEGALARIRTSPIVERLDITFYDDAEQKWLRENWQRLMDSVAPRPDERPFEATTELTMRCEEAARRLRAGVRGEPHLDRALGELLACLTQGEKTSTTRLGFSARQTVEQLVNALCRKYRLKVEPLFEKNIETLASKGRFSRWFISYLHTLRTLGNEAVHLSGRRVVPETLGAVEELVLLSLLLRVLTVWPQAMVE